MPELTAIQLDELRHKLRVERAVVRETEWLKDNRPITPRPCLTPKTSKTKRLPAHEFPPAN